jgi:medium-chain acyl-[acyl-carrier-protein] hydrolase
MNAVPPNPSIVHSNRSSDAKIRIFCVPYACAGPTAYAGFAHLIPQEIDFCAVRFPGRESRLAETPVDNFDHLVTLLSDLVQECGDLPYAILGDCSGAAIMLEVARTLRERRSALPVALFGSAFPAPQLRSPADPLSEMPFDALLQRMRGFGSLTLPALLDPELALLLEPMFRADLRAVETRTYRNAEPLPVPLTVFAGRRDPCLTLSSLLPWADHTTTAFTLHLLDGGHFILTEQPELAAGILLGDLDRAFRASHCPNDSQAR